MAERVIDPFEIVEIDPNQRAVISIAQIAGQVRFERLGEGITVQEPSCGVILGQEGRALLTEAQSRNIRRRSAIAFESAIAV